MAQVSFNRGSIENKLTNRIEARLKKFNRQTMKQLENRSGHGGIWAYDEHRRVGHTYPHSVDRWRSYKQTRNGKISYVYRNDARNKSNQLYAKYLKGAGGVFNSPQLTEAQWKSFVSSRKHKLKEIIKGK